ncbi:hypothetical protein LINGRAHAP2_LOCUS33476 [Linum grandiflorum]
MKSKVGRNQTASSLRGICGSVHRLPHHPNSHPYGIRKIGDSKRDLSLRRV